MRDGAADAGIMAIENTTSGGLLPNFELLRGNDFKIKGEIYIPIHQNLMALKGQKLNVLGPNIIFLLVLLYLAIILAVLVSIYFTS